jgi:hypothetical protein
MISTARLPCLSILAAAARARSRLGGSCASQSMQLLALVMAAAMGCLISCAGDAAISPGVLARLRKRIVWSIQASVWNRPDVAAQPIVVSGMLNKQIGAGTRCP